MPLAGGFDVEVVGESNYQEALGVQVGMVVERAAGWIGPTADAARGRRLLVVLRAIGVVGLAGFWAWATVTHPEINGKPFGVDAQAYWGADLADPYSGPAAGLPGAYLYSPAFLQAFAPLRLLPWDAFMALWLAAELVALAWLISPLGALALLAFPPALSEVLIGNIHIFLAVALVVSIRHPAAWTLAMLTKPTLGVGVMWYAARREWRALAMALGATLLLAVLSFALSPELWFAWVERLRGAETRGGIAWSIFLGIRLLLAVALVGYAGWRKRPAFLPVALYLALPIPWLEGLTLLAAAPRLAQQRPRSG